MSKTKKRSEACPGCGCEPGDGVTESCNHPQGCGYWKRIAEQVKKGETKPTKK